jgi:metallo-beta-lactamase family protein
MKLTFWGAARQVTGSMFLLELEDGFKILIDCGTDFSKNKNQDPLFPFRPSEIDLVLLTHAHLDHSGNIPNLIIGGYKNQILCTPATYSLAEIILRDSALIQTQNLKKRLGKEKSKFKATSSNTGNMYMERQVYESLEQFVTIGFNKRFEINEHLSVTFYPAGHLLGAAYILLDIEEKGIKKSIVFSGDIGRKNYPLLQDPHVPPQADYVVCETTYGQRVHSAEGNPEDLLQDIIQKACVDIPGRLIIPSFSVGRTQSLLYSFYKLAKDKRLPPIKVFADSPMAEQSTKVYEDFVSILNDEAKAFYSLNNNLFDFSNLVHVSSLKESKAISNHSQSCIIISSSGMLNGGRIEEHLKKNLGNPYCTILMIGFAAEGTPGHQLLNEKTVTIKGRNIPVTATVLSTDIFSGHGDKNDLINFVKSQSKERLKKVFLVHGEYESMIQFKKSLEEEGYSGIEMPKKGETYQL